LEDAELEVMQRQEDVEGLVTSLTAEVAAVEAEEHEVAARRDVAFAEIDAALAGLSADRGGLVTSLPADLVALYDKLRNQYGGVGAAPLENGRCLGCRLELTPADRDRIKAEPADAVVRCEECRRILVRR
jgi:predicted  nucleic acid-binding Zn-ribbon protein